MFTALVGRVPYAGDGWVIPGSPPGVVELSRQLNVLAQATEECGGDVDRARAGLGCWIGQGASAFEQLARSHRSAWRAAAEALATAGGALARYAEALEGAQRRAQSAFDLYQEGESESAAWLATSVAARGGGPVHLELIGYDYGAAKMSEARSSLAAARAEADQAAAALVAVLRQTEAVAPRREGIWSRVLGAVDTDFRLVDDFGQGVLAGVVGMGRTTLDAGRLSWNLSPARLAADPKGWERSVKEEMEAGLAFAAAVRRDPLGVGQAMLGAAVDAKDWSSDPAKAAGEMAPQLAAMIDGEGEALTVAKATEDAAAAARDAELGEHAASAVGPDGELPSWLSPAARKVLEHRDRTGSTLKGYKGRGGYVNDGRGGGVILPAESSEGDAIIYQKWDVHPYVRGVSRGQERLVTGSDGSAWYTDSHYSSFRRIR